MDNRQALQIVSVFHGNIEGVGMTKESVIDKILILYNKDFFHCVTEAIAYVMLSEGLYTTVSL